MYLNISINRVRVPQALETLETPATIIARQGKEAQKIKKL
jgi:hypothetical protein